MEDNGAEEFANPTTNDLIMAASTGRFWIVRKCIEISKIPLNEQDYHRVLEVAVRNGRTSIVKYLLDNNCLRHPDVLKIACQKGYTRITALLLERNSRFALIAGSFEERTGNTELDNATYMRQALVEAVKHGNTGCVRLLLQYSVDVHVDHDLPLLEACSNRHLEIIASLLKAGSYINCRDGQPLIESATNGHNDVIQTLIDHGADISINDNAALKAAVTNGNTLSIIILLNHGADANVLDSYDIDETLMTIIKAFTKRSVFVRLKRAIHESLCRKDFKWQTLCSCRNPDLDTLRQQADLFDISYEKNDSKFALCAKLASKHEKLVVEKPTYENHLTDFTGTPINDLPFWKIIAIEGIPFNCFDLFKMLKNGYTTNPYTRNPLPINVIREREKFLHEVLTTYRFKDINLLETVKQNPILTDSMLLRNILEKEVWDNLEYTPSLSIIMDATDETIDEMMRKLVIICKHPSLFEIISPGLDIYSMLTTSAIANIYLLKELDKKKAFVKLLSSMVNVDDEHRGTRRIPISIMLKTFANPNENGEDDFSFMLGTTYTTGSDDEDDLQVFGWDDDS